MLGKIIGYINDIKEWLKGKKTYLLAVATIITVTVQYAEGSLDFQSWFYAVTTALGFSTVRAGIDKK
jgi:type IV secretory pathway VirB2 component (pilin)